MSRTALEQAKAAWGEIHAGLTREEIDRRVMGFGALVRGIAEDGAVTPEDFSRSTSLNAVQATELFTSLTAFGLERDEGGRIIGAALTTKPTDHVIQIAGKRLFAWCALDTLFIPGLLETIGEVESTCPVSRTAVRLSVTPEGVRSVDPPGAVLSVVLPAVGSSDSTGPASPT